MLGDVGDAPPLLAPQGHLRYNQPAPPRAAHCNPFIAAIMAHLSITLLGSFQVALDDQPVTGFGTDKTRALLAYLVVEAGRPHRRDALAGLFWPERPQARARQSLRQALAQLRQVLGDEDGDQALLAIDRDAVQFNPNAHHTLDVAEFLRLAEANRQHRHRRLESCLPCLERMKAMERLYGGDLLGGFYLSDSTPFEEWATLQREYLQQQAMEALDHLARYYQRRGELREAIRAVRRQIQLEPWREEAHRQLMRMLAQDGQRSAALAQYRDCQRALAHELDVKPTSRTTALYEQIRKQQSDRAGSVPATPHNLPVPATPFIGREEELAELAELVANPDCRLVTLVGAGGMGKTRLALQVATHHVGLFRHGVTFVPLAPVESADLLVPTLADALHLQMSVATDPEQQILDYLREKEQLLVLDNVEHLLDGSDLVARILSHAPEVMLLATSRARLRLREEWVYEVEGLSRPAETASRDWEAYSALTLFAEGARRADRRFRLTEEVGPCVARICRMVEGMPLAVELAAAWMGVHSCEEIAADLERSLDSLSTRQRNAPERHASLRASLEHSWNLLAEGERAAFRRLSVFRAGFGPDAAAQVGSASTEILSALVDKSLLRRNGDGRYDMHRLLRQYAEEKLGEVPEQQRAAEDLLCTYYSQFLQEREARLQGPGQAEALAEIAAEIDNVRFACRVGLARGKVDAMGRSMGSLGTFYAIRSWHQEGARIFGRAADQLSSNLGRGAGADPAEHDVVLGACLAWQGFFRYQLGDYEAAQELLENSLALLEGQEGRRELAFALATLAQILCFGKNRYAEAAALFGRGLDLYRGLDDRYGQAQCLDGLGDVSARQGDHEGARAYYEEGLTLRRKMGDLWGISVSLGSLGGLAGRLGDYQEARQRFEESLAIGRKIENPRGVAASLHNLSTVAYLQQECAEARRLRQETPEICQEIGYRWGIASALKSLGDVAGRMGDYEQAIEYLKESLKLLQEDGDRRSQAYTLNSLGAVAQSLGRRGESWQHFRGALAAAMEIQEPALALDVLASMAGLMAGEGQAEQALKVTALVLQHPASEQQTRDQIRPLRRELAGRVPAEAVTAAERQGQALTIDELAARLLSVV